MKKRFILKVVVGAVIPSLVLFFSVYQYSHQTANNLAEQFRHELWLQKKAAYEEVCSTLGTIASGLNTENEYKDEMKRFSGLYYGKARLNDDSAVYNYLADILATLRADFDYADPSQLDVFRNQVIHLDSLCRISMAEKPDKR